MLDTTLRPKPSPARGKRSALWALLGLVPSREADGDVRHAAGDPSPLPADAYPVHPSRAAAHAAYRTVEGGGPKALDAALAVVEAEARALRLAVLRQEEALKLLRLYASDEWARSVAKSVLEAPAAPLAPSLPVTLYDRELAESTASGWREER
ncbi:MAG TPA: hypothetical protein VK022_04745 [Paracoccaceae bacterium]|nr:hypothetical protein [Paracoccaceae bacterium]